MTTQGGCDTAQGVLLEPISEKSSGRSAGSKGTSEGIGRLGKIENHVMPKGAVSRWPAGAESFGDEHRKTPTSGIGSMLWARSRESSFGGLRNKLRPIGSPGRCSSNACLRSGEPWWWFVVLGELPGVT